MYFNYLKSSLTLFILLTSVNGLEDTTGLCVDGSPVLCERAYEFGVSAVFSSYLNPSPRKTFIADKYSQPGWGGGIYSLPIQGVTKVRPLSPIIAHSLCALKLWERKNAD
jgi:hypothetical protein